MLSLSFRTIVTVVTAIAMAAAMSAVSLPAAGAEPRDMVDIREWEVPYEGRPRDPFVAGPDTVWFVGQTTGYLARLTPPTGEFFKRDLKGRPARIT